MATRILRRLAVFQDAFSIREFLGHTTSSCKHGKASVLKLLGGHDFELSWIGWLQSEGVKAYVARGVVVTEETGLTDRSIAWVHPSDLSAASFDATNCNG